MVEVEHTIRSIPIDENLGAEVQKLRDEGWDAVPGVLPVAVYHLVRIRRNKDEVPKEEPPAEEAPPAPRPAAVGGIGVLGIDDSKVFVLRGSEVV